MNGIYRWNIAEIQWNTYCSGILYSDMNIDGILLKYNGVLWDLPDEHIIYNILKTLFHLFYSFLGLAQWNIMGYTMDINGL